MIDKPLTVPEPFSSYNPPPEVSCCLLSTKLFIDDNHLCLLTTGGAFLEIIADVVLSDEDDYTESTRLPGQTAPNRSS
jgi:hypothetical protein